MSHVNEQSRPFVSAADDGAAQVEAWLDQFAAAVRAADYDGARALFETDVVSFGTFARMVQGIDALVDEQWRRIWSCTRGFRFLIDDAHIEIADALAWVATPWMSQGRDEAGRWYDRSGRCTLVLVLHGRQWRCVHSHFSREPALKMIGSATPA